MSSYLEFNLNNCYIDYFDIKSKRCYFRKYDEKETFETIHSQYERLTGCK